mmetsp:Transcript_44378/g.144053  ORF Transcript_44378/g.144053 Transcript_44378/m.144053 type:complete len:218 (-) Transcript_44378:142-795(-)
MPGRLPRQRHPRRLEVKCAPCASGQRARLDRLPRGARGCAGGAAAVCAVPPHPADGALSRRRRHERTREDTRWPEKGREGPRSPEMTRDRTRARDVGTMADWVGRQLGLPSLQINPGMGVKLFRRDDDPAVESLTARSFDLVSVMEALHARDRRVVFRWPRHALSAALHLVVVVVSLAALLASPAPGWARTSGAAGVVAALLAYVYWMHSVLRFTPR